MLENFKNANFKQLQSLIKSGADTSDLHWNPLFFSVAFGKHEDVAHALKKYPDLEIRDNLLRTPFLVAIQTGDTKKVDFLLKNNADRNAVTTDGKTALFYAIDNNNTKMLQWLLDNGFNIEELNFCGTPLTYASETGKSVCVQLLLQNSADIFHKNSISQTAINVAINSDTVKLLVDAGANINDLSIEAHAKLVGVKSLESVTFSEELQHRDKKHTFAKGNPTKIDNPLWLELIKTGVPAHAVKAKADEHPVWCYHRFGRSTSFLDDGRIIDIGGEHEDWYDEDFCIYNDVTVFYGNFNI